MGKVVKIDGKNRVVISVLKELGVIDEEDTEIEIVPNATTGLLHRPVEDKEDVEMILHSLDAHKRHYEIKRNKLEQKD